MNRPDHCYPHDAGIRKAELRKERAAVQRSWGRGRGHVREPDRGYTDPPHIHRGPGTVRLGTFGFTRTYINEPDESGASGPWGMSDLPWDRNNVLGKEHEIRDLQPASKKWLKALDLLGDDEDGGE